MPPLQQTNLEQLIKKLKKSAIIEECWDCECFQGLIAQLEMDFDEATASPQLKSLIIEAEKLHYCLGCDPCPPAELYSHYLIEKAGLGKDESVDDEVL